LKKIVQKHTLAIRWLHWINFPLLTIMIWSGMLIYWGNDVYRLGWGDKTLLKFFPDSFNKALNIPFRLAEGMNLHFFFMWFFTINGIVYFFYLLFSKEYKLIFPHKNALKEAWQVLLHSLRIKKGLPPQKKYNAAQRIAYTGIIFLGFGIIITGLAIYKPAQLYWLCYILGGYEWARILHFVITILFVLFFVVHVLQVVFAGFNNFRAMLTGFEVVKDKKEEVTNE
jgi:thiosulfate reductase cytochrome b subunit